MQETAPDVQIKGSQASIKELAENEERYRTLVEGIYDYAVFTTDPEGYILSWNPGAARIKNYSYEEAIGMHFSQLYPEDAAKRGEPMEHLHEALVEGSYRGQGLRRKKGGEIFMADVYIRPIFIEGRHIGFAKVVSDLDEENKLKNEVSETRAEVSELKVERELRERFISTLSHDLRSPLAIARGTVEYLLRKPKNLDENLKRVITAINRADRMIKDLLDANKLKVGGKLPSNIIKCDLVVVLEELMQDFSYHPGNKVHFNHPESLEGYWDPEAVRRIVENLVSNAIKYGEANRPVTVNLKASDERAILEVHNFGKTIKSEDQEKIFNHFERVDSEDNNGKVGWGIGLTLVKGLTTALAGEVKVRSLPSEGTIFTIDLPKDSRLIH